MKEAIAMLHTWLVMLEAGHVKTGMQEATKEQLEFSTALLQAIIADMEAKA